MNIIHVEIAGITPLLVNRFHEDAREEASSGNHSRKEALSPEEDARKRLYLLDGKPCFPAENIRQAIVAAASRHKIGRKTASSDVAAAVFVSPDAILIDGEWEVDERAVVIPATKGRIIRWRPKFPTWRMGFELHYDPRLLDENLLRRIFDDAGNYVGFGDFRPQRRGPFGRFMIVLWNNGK